MSRADGIQGFCESLDKAIIRGGQWLSWAYLLIVLISVYEVFMRYVLGSPTTWVHESSIALAGVCMVYGGLFAFAKNKHIRIAMLTDLMNPTWQGVFKLFSGIVELVYITLLSAATFLIMKQAVFAPDGSIQLERSGSAWNPPFPGIVKLLMLVMIVLFAFQMAVHVAVSAVQLCHRLRKR